MKAFGKAFGPALAMALLAGCSSAAAQPAPPSNTVTVELAASDVQLLTFVANAIGQGCAGTADGVDKCRAAILAHDLLVRVNAAIIAKAKPSVPSKPEK